jgi:spore coat protein A, manganese oxidase
VKKTAMFAWAVLLPLVLFCATPATAQLLDPTTLTKYMDPLPQPPLQAPDGYKNGVPRYDVHLKQVNQKLHSQLDSTTVFTFDGQTPGPTFLVRTGQPIYVRYINDLPQNHMFNVDTTIHVMAGMGWGQSSRFVAHLHGGDVPAWSDGWCMDAIYPGQETTFYYPNSQPAATLWYHDHSCGITRLNAYAGIAGFYIIIDPLERSLNMPAGPYEVGIAAQDRQFYANGQLYYPPDWVPEFFGDVSLVNGVVWPRMTVEPRKYRIHFLNGCDDRYINIKLVEADSAGNVPIESVAGPAIYQVGTEQGLVPNTLVFNNTRLLVAPGDRRDLIIDFSGKQGKHFIVSNNASAPFDGTFPDPIENPLTDLWLFDVKDTTVTDLASIPMHPRTLRAYNPRTAYRTRDVFLHEMQDAQGNPMMVMLNDLSFMDPTTDFPKYQTTEVWRLINTTVDEHPIHLHLVNFQILDRQPFNVDTFLVDHTLIFTGPPEPPLPTEIGNHDMANSSPGYVTRIMTSPFNRLGKYVYHCHILAHEENDMMRPYEVTMTGEGPMVAGTTTLPDAVYLANGASEPFRGRSAVFYGVPYEQKVRLSVYNSLGQEVRSLVNGPVKAGHQRVTWNGTDNSGRQVAAGAYFYKLETASGSQTQRATLLR